MRVQPATSADLWLLDVGIMFWCNYGCVLQGKDLFMDLDEGSLKLVDPENLTVLNTQPIHTIRVWGVGRDNGR